MLDLGDALRDLASRNEASCLAIVVQAARGSVRAGAKALFDAAGVRRGGDAVLSEKLERELGQRAAQAVAAGEPALVDLSDDACGAALKLYLEPHQRSRELVVLGRGPVASALAKVGEACGFRVRSVPGDFDAVEPPAAGSHAVVATGHEADEAALAAALLGRPASVQLVASSRRAPTVLAALRKSGIAEDKVALVRSPAGLDLGGESPEEIALSILAEIQALRRGGSGRPLSEVKGMRASAPSAESAPRAGSFLPPSSTTRPGSGRLPLVAPAPVDAAPPPSPAPASPPRSILAPNAARKPKVKFAMEDSEEYAETSRHDEDFRPDEEEKPEKAAPSPPRSERVTRRTRKRPAGDEESFR